ncbi:trimeric intracellular cation channel family protein [Mesonia sp. K7]|uniref:trimeric intracellular cation channel family protein n=1 Tax=Mesonia sp. K7 TaxID=2218606 RepID=UPI000DA76B49|nr:trimeric intracellular cation channel family protein [Mesonia sp. K7]PZD77308.1 trimeric intracellular cation channel family protein [Mesonia sp. K7]
MNYVEIIDILGTIAFAISGALASMKKKMDVFGILIIAFATAVGGGTLRDVLLDVPITWMRNTTYVYIIIASVIFTLIFRSKLGYLRTSLFLFDTIGIGLYTVIGIQKGIGLELPIVICIAIGTMSACFGGVIRDTLLNEIPVIFRKEVYATACILGGVSFFVLQALNVSDGINYIVSGLVVIAIRLIAVIFKVQLPNIYKEG